MQVPHTEHDARHRRGSSSTRKAKPQSQGRLQIPNGVSDAEIALGGTRTEDFRIDNMPARVAMLGDLWAPLLERKARFDLQQLL